MDVFRIDTLISSSDSRHGFHCLTSRCAQSLPTSPANSFHTIESLGAVYDTSVEVGLLSALPASQFCLFLPALLRVSLPLPAEPQPPRWLFLGAQRARCPVQKGARSRQCLAVTWAIVFCNWEANSHTYYENASFKSPLIVRTLFFLAHAHGICEQALVQDGKMSFTLPV